MEILFAFEIIVEEFHEMLHKNMHFVLDDQKKKRLETMKRQEFLVLE